MPARIRALGSLPKQRAQRRQETGLRSWPLGWRRVVGPARRTVFDVVAHIGCEEPTTIGAWPPMLTIFQMILLVRYTPNRRCPASIAEMDGLIVRVIAHFDPVTIALGAKFSADIANHDGDVVL